MGAAVTVEGVVALNANAVQVNVNVRVNIHGDGYDPPVACRVVALAIRQRASPGV